MTKKPSRFLQTPIEPFTVEGGLTADQVLARMERISFQGRNLATALHIWQKMLQDDVTIFFGMAGALSAGGLRLIVAHLVANRYVDCVVSTGANLYHDLHETRGQHHYIGSPHPHQPTTGGDGILTAAYRANVPIFCPAIADSSIGMGLSQARQLKADCGHIDTIGD